MLLASHQSSRQTLPLALLPFALSSCGRSVRAKSQPVFANVPRQRSGAIRCFVEPTPPTEWHQALQQFKDESLAREERFKAESLAREERLRGEVSTLWGEASTLRGEVSTLRGEASTLRGEVSTLTGDLATLRDEVAPLQRQYVYNAVHQVAKLVLTGKKPAKRDSALTYVDHAVTREEPAARLEKLAGLLRMGSIEVKSMLQAVAQVRNEGEHPPDLESLRFMVSAARQACGQKPTDAHLIFARRFLDAYEEIEKEFLL